MSTVDTHIVLGAVKDHNEALEKIRAEKLKDAQIVLDELKLFLTDSFKEEGQISVVWHEGNDGGKIEVKTKDINASLVRKKVEDFLFPDE